MSKSHGIVATSWQLESARKNQLKAVILPLQKYFNYPIHEVDHNGLGMAVYNNGFNMGFVDECFREGESIYLQSRWVKVPEDNIYFTEVDTSEAEILGWQPAETMPMAAALYRYKITKVEVRRRDDIEIADLCSSGLIYNAAPTGSGEIYVVQRTASQGENGCWFVVLRLGDWEPAETMPMEAAQYRYKITDVEVK